MDSKYFVYMKAFIDIFLIKEVDLGTIERYFSEEEYELQDYICNNLKKEFQWLTGIGLIESAIRNVYESRSNANI